MALAGATPPRPAAATEPLGGETQVNTSISGDQDEPAVARSPDGRYVIVWQQADADGGGIWARRYSADGLPSPPFQVNDYATGEQSAPTVAMDADGDFVVAWAGAGSGDAAGAFVRRFSATGAAQGASVGVNVYTTGIQEAPAVAMDADGDFVVAWQGQGKYDAGGVYARRFAADGSTFGLDLQVNTYTTSSQGNAAVAMDADGDFVVAWQSFNQDGDRYGIYARRYDAAGSPLGDELPVNNHVTDDQFDPVVAMDADGDFAVAWVSYGQDGTNSFGVYARRYDAMSGSFGTEVPVNTWTTSAQGEPTLGMDADGDFTVAWASFSQDGNDWGVFAQRFDATGELIGEELRVNTYTDGTQRDPALAMDATGNLVVAWESFGQDGDRNGVYAQRFAGHGDALDLALELVNAQTSGVQDLPAVAMDADGDLVVVWEGAGPEDPDGIFARRYGADGAALGPPFAVNLYTTGTQRHPAVAMDLYGDFVVVWEGAGADDTDGVFLRRFAADGSRLGSEERVNPFSGGIQVNPAVAAAPDGRFVVAWNGGGFADVNGIQARRYSATGSALDPSEISVNTYTTSLQSNPAVALDAAGDFVVAWQSFNQDGDGYGIYARRFAADGTGLDPADFLVHVGWSVGPQVFPAVARDAEGNFVIAWGGQFLGDPDDGGVHAQRYAADGTPQAAAFTVNTHTTDAQSQVAVAMDRDGDFVVAWQSRYQDGSLKGVYAQRFDAEGSPVGGERRVNDYTTGDQGAPAVATDADGDFVVAWAGESKYDADGIYAQRFRGPGCYGEPLATGYFNVAAGAHLDCVSYSAISAHDLLVEPGGELIFTAPAIGLGPGTVVEAGGVLTAGP